MILYPRSTLIGLEMEKLEQLSENIDCPGIGLINQLKPPRRH